MPTFTGVALERLIEPGDSRSSTDSKPDRSNSMPARANGDDARPVPVPYGKPAIPLPPAPGTSTAEKEMTSWPRISPALYSTPESTPLPDSPTSVSPSPYLINHKRRGPRLLMNSNSSEASVFKEKIVDEKVSSSSHLSDAEFEAKSTSLVENDVVVPQSDSDEEKKTNGFHEEMIENGDPKDLPGTSSVEKESEIEDFFDLQESMSFTSNTDGEDFGADLSARANTPGGAFYDASDELSSESGRQMLSSMHDLETELREMRLSLLMEVEKRKQAEDALKNMRSQWQRLREELREAGLVLPTDHSIMAQDVQMNVDFTEEICQQIYITRFVSESIGRGAARAEYEEEMEAQLEWKNFEIARLCDRMHYYETMNREMSQRNQDAIELARRDIQRGNQMQKWVWASIAAAVTLGSVAIAWSYFPSAKGPSSHQLNASEPDSSTE